MAYRRAVVASRFSISRLKRVISALRTLHSPSARLQQLHTEFRQQEALHGLYRELKLDRSLPATRGWAASPDFLLAITRHALMRRPHTIVECGSGVSTIVLARCAQLNQQGHVHSLDHDAKFAQHTRNELHRLELSSWATVIDAPLVPVQRGSETWLWYDDRELPPDQIDLLNIDGPPPDGSTAPRYLAAKLLERLARGGSAFVDDSNRPAEQQALKRWRAEFPSFQETFLDCEKGCAVLSNGAE